MPKSAAAKYAGKHPDTTTLLPNGKLHFTATGMDFPATVTNEVIEAYVNGKAYRRACARKRNQDYDFTQHLPYIVPHKHKNEKHFLYCTLTNVTLPKDSTMVETHINAKKFKRMLQALEAAKEQKKNNTEKRKKKTKEQGDEENGDMKDVEEKEDEANGNENENGDVLDGILSDDEEEENSESDEDDEGNTNEEVADVRMEEDEKMEDADVFWTRGNHSSHTAENGDTDDEWGTSKETPSLKVTKVKKVVEKKKPNKAATATVIGKRGRKGDSATTPKKIRQVRRRRKSNTTSET